MRRLKVSESKSIVLRVSLKTLMVPLVQYLFYPNTTASMQYARKCRYIPFFAFEPAARSLVIGTTLCFHLTKNCNHKTVGVCFPKVWLDLQQNAQLHHLHRA